MGNRNSLKRAILEIHKIGIRFGVHVLPVHFYSPVPNIIEMRKTKDIWAKKSELPGISVNLVDQVENLKTICLPYQAEYAGNKYYMEGVSNHFGPGYGYIEAQALHGFIRCYKPQHIIEVGSGVSTYCMRKAADINLEASGQTTTITAIEPYPSSQLQALPGVEIKVQQVQTLAFEVFKALRENDLLFIDSSHTVKPGGDVNFIILEVLPRLHKGVFVHFHDIYLPYDYQRDVCDTFLYWAETSLLHAYLINNSKVQIVFCLSQLHYECQRELREVFPDYHPQGDENGLAIRNNKPFDPMIDHFPASIYLQIL